MLKPLARSVLFAILLPSLAGCSAAGKRPGGRSPAATKGLANPFKSSAAKVRRDVAQTQLDLGELESQVKLPK